MYQTIIITDHVLIDDHICLRAHTPANMPVILTAQFGLSYTNFTLKHNYTTAVDNDNEVLLEHYLCGDVCGQQCNPLGITNYSDWAAVLGASVDTCFASYTENGIHGVHDPYIHQSFNGFGAYATAHPGVFPTAPSTTTSVAPTVLYPEKADNDAPMAIALSIGAGITTLSIVAIVAYSCTADNAERISSAPTRVQFNPKAVDVSNILDVDA